jgi:hypothetical protein
MTKEEIAYRKMALMFDGKNAVEAIIELEEAAREVLLLHTGCSKGEWMQILTNQYRTELVDAYGMDIDALALSRELDKLWNKIQKKT